MRRHFNARILTQALLALWELPEKLVYVWRLLLRLLDCWQEGNVLKLLPK